jgi:hypothetical protein
MPDFLFTVMVRARGVDSEGNPRTEEQARKIVGDNLAMKMNGIMQEVDFDRRWDAMHESPIAKVEIVPSQEEELLEAIRQAREPFLPVADLLAACDVAERRGFSRVDLCLMVPPPETLTHTLPEPAPGLKGSFISADDTGWRISLLIRDVRDWAARHPHITEIPQVKVVS